jgi:hypothetical protein
MSHIAAEALLQMAIAMRAAALIAAIDGALGSPGSPLRANDAQPTIRRSHDRSD